jgi:S-formylglutathione hydrolase FrmB
MKVRTCALLLTLALLPAPGRLATASEWRGRIFAATLPAPSLRDSARSVRVYLPPTYERPEAAKRRYPVVYLLHGWPGGDGNWPGSGHAAETLDSLSARGAIPEVIAVMPNGNGIGRFGRQEWLDSWDGRACMEELVWQDLVRWSDRTFRTRPDSLHRALIGLSEGATGALNIAFKHPGVFNACGGLSGQYVMSDDWGMKAVWADGATADRIREANSPMLYIARIVQTARQQVIYFDCGSGDEELSDNRAFHRKLVELGVPHTYNEFSGSHGWGYWKVHLRDALIACTARMD